MSTTLTASLPELPITDPTIDSAWDDQLSAHRDATAFHTSAWARVLIRTYGHQPFYLQSGCGDSSELLPLMEVASPFTGTRAVALPFTDLCPRLGSAGNGAQQAWFPSLVRRGKQRGWSRIELRGGTPPAPDARPFQSYYGHVLDLSEGEDQLFNGLHSSVRRAIRKARREGLSVGIHHDEAAVAQFYRLHTETRRLHGAPPQPWSFFRNLFEEILSGANGWVALARRGAEVLAGAVFLRFGHHVIYKYGASRYAQRHLRPNNLLFWEVIRMLVGDGCSTLDFGRTSLWQQELRRFKLGWGTSENLINYYRWDLNRDCWSISGDDAPGFHTQLFSRFPLALNKLFGRLLYPHLD